ncbi:MAG: hypothetical protein K2I67_00940 [Malacoplasma sp.]|nr:hypothetical protein [Malacoplasma sp.]
MAEKVRVEINQDVYEKIKQQYEQAKDAYSKLNINSVDDFISYVLENFTNSSQQFEKLSDQMKQLMENVDMSNLSFEDLFKSIAQSSIKKDQNKEDEKNDSLKKEEKKS